MCARWIPRFLTIDQKAKGVRLSNQNSEVFRHNEKEFLRLFMRMDETWIHCHMPDSNRQSEEWLLTSESHYLQHGKTINKQYYISTLLDRWDNEIESKRPHYAPDTTDKLKKLRYEVVLATVFATISPQLLFPVFPVEKWLAGDRFYSNEEIQYETNPFFEGLDADHYKKVIEMLKDRYTNNKSITLDGDYVKE
ncbi:unnamed protein product [Euphydryas editha]|uniref:Uncharacterized protein n=1 Tax=Euphydryas editha TaxID=104508 RepID=A0AAU9UW59_EUPED|nr:unnamed protein product [Euphydryas editha]